MDYGTEFSQIGHYLKEEGLIGYFTFSHINLTHEGAKEAERFMEESYSQKERLVLEAIADMSRMSAIVIYQDLAKRLGMTFSTLRTYCFGLEEKGYINFPGGDFVEIKAAGYEALEPPKPKVASVNYMHIGTNFGNAGQGSNINQTVNVNPDFDKAVGGLLQLIQSSSLENHDKEDLQEEIQKVAALAIREPSPGLLDKAKSRMEIIKVGLQAANLLTAASPYLESLWGYFKIKYHL